jgi:hypothetical protein
MEWKGFKEYEPHNRDELLILTKDKEVYHVYYDEDVSTNSFIVCYSEMKTISFDDVFMFCEINIPEC